MRTSTLLLLLLVASVYVTNAQRFSLLPQAGFESSRTNISYNDLRSFSPLGTTFSPQASLRLTYASKKGHGFFLGGATNRSLVRFSFTDPENGMNNFIASAGDMRVQLEGGYQFNSRQISLNKAKQSSSKKGVSKSPAKKNCGSYTSRSSSGKNYTASNRCSGNNKAKQQVHNKTWKGGSWVRMQPLAGLAFTPGAKTGIAAKIQAGQITYEYNAGNTNLAFVAGTGFEFGNNHNRLFTVGINYFKGIGNLTRKTLSTQSGTKSVTTVLGSGVSGWNLRVGIPFSLSKKPVVKERKEIKIREEKKCGEYKIIYRCGKRS
jgi:hypothetical protein